MSAVAAVALTLCHGAPSAAADPIGDFFKRVGRTLSKPAATTSRQKTHKSSTAPSKAHPQAGSPAAPAPPADESAAQPMQTPVPPAQPTPAPPQLTTAKASVAPQSSGDRDLPYAVPVASRPGFVTSPYAPTRGMVDVRGFPSGTEVKDPYTGKIFRTP
jgi:hypothetical protein